MDEPTVTVLGLPGGPRRRSSSTGSTRLANQAVTECRERDQQDVLGHRGHKDDPLYKIRRLLLVGAERLNEKGWERLQEGLESRDRGPG